jgi:undecaprenyl-diphosphatase
MLDFVLNLDNNITQLVIYIIPRNRFFNLFFLFFSEQGSLVLILLIIVLTLILFEGKRDQKFFISLFLIFLLTFLTNDVFLKTLFKRSRPDQLTIDNNPLTVKNLCPKDFSFPSGHAATAFAAAASLSFFDKKRKKFYYSVALIIGLSRIYLSCHFFFDVVIGGLIGYLISKIALSGIKSHSNKQPSAQIM